MSPVHRNWYQCGWATECGHLPAPDQRGGAGKSPLRIPHYEDKRWLPGLSRGLRFMALLLDSRDGALTEEEKNDLLAIDALREESVTELKEQGNAYVKKGKAHYSDAVDCYTRAIQQRIDDPLQTSVLYANRSHVNLLLGNYRRALNDAKDAIKLNPSNLKAYFRGAKAALALELFDEASQLCVGGLEGDSTSSELKSLKDQAESKMKEAADRKLRSKQTQELVTAFEQRHVKLGPHLYKDLSGDTKPWLDSSNVLHWPVLFLYGEVMTSDLIEDFSEFDQFKPHLKLMFGSGDLAWDEKREYTLNKVELYYQANAVATLSRKEVAKQVADGFDIDDNEYDDEAEKDANSHYGSERRWVKVDENWTLRDVLARPDFVVPGIPVFYIVARGSRFRDLFLSGAWSPP